ncbi:MAG: hypothetical protein EOP51_03025 [Sphingobacteriales bacterium]|nr:MAG: hypothetical protein EOP51_03025 [Sphingobacteriales bacterium]
MENITKEYSNGEITVVWKPGQCIHSTLCWKGLIGVFNPKKRPWVDIQGAGTNNIKDQVEKCPSGALSYFMNKAGEAKPAIAVETTVEVTANGPLLVYGNITVKNKNGAEEKKYKVTALCRCGASANKPYCDGSHVKTGFKDE